MSNVLKVNEQETIVRLLSQGWSKRKVARELGVHRNTVRHYAGLLSKCTTNSTAGSKEGFSKCTGISTAGKLPGRRSQCEGFDQTIRSGLSAGLTAQRIFQDLRADHGYAGSYESVKRYVRRVTEKDPLRVQRVESAPGEELQIDFGKGPPIPRQDGKSQKTWIFRAVLSYSRKGYSEAVLRQDSETFLRVLENALRSFGGVPHLLNLDNLKAGVLKADWYDPDLHPKLAAFCRHYGMHPMPCRPRKPEHKGKVERGVGYVKSNALKARNFRTLGDINACLEAWERQTADLRIHGTTRKQVRALFEQEQESLQALPPMLFPSYQEARRSVHRDSYVEVAKSLYEVPSEYIGRQVWVEWDARVVRVYNDRREQIALHARIEPGKLSRCLGTGGHARPIQASCRYWQRQAAMLGEHCGSWAQRALDKRGPEALRAIMGLCHMTRTHAAEQLNQACSQALERGGTSLREVRILIETTEQQQRFTFAQEHPLIRDLKTYGNYIDTITNDNEHTTTTRTNP